MGTMKCLLLQAFYRGFTRALNMFGVGLGPGISAFIIPQQFIHVRVAGIGLVRALGFPCWGFGLSSFGAKQWLQNFCLSSGDKFVGFGVWLLHAKPQRQDESLDHNNRVACVNKSRLPAANRVGKP